MMKLSIIYTTFFFGLLTVVISQAACPKTDGNTTVQAAFENSLLCAATEKEFIDNGGAICLTENPTVIIDCTQKISFSQKQLYALTTEDCKALSTAETCVLEQFKKCNKGQILADVVSASFKKVLKESPCSSSSRPATFGLGIQLTMVIMVFSQ